MLPDFGSGLDRPDDPFNLSNQNFWSSCRSQEVRLLFTVLSAIFFFQLSWPVHHRRGHRLLRPPLAWHVSTLPILSRIWPHCLVFLA